MPTYQIQKLEVIGRYAEWTQAFGLNPRSFLRADGQEISLEITEGKHLELLALVQSRQPLTDFREGSKEQQTDRLILALSKFVYPDERINHLST